MKQGLPTLRERYEKDAAPALKAAFGYTNPMSLPKVTKVVVNAGVGRAAHDPKELEVVQKTLEMITGQKPVLTRARKSISAFKVRQGMPMGAMVTLRGRRMQHFLEKLIHVTLPRIRDFRGLSSGSFGRSGILTIGIKEHMAFPEVSSESVEKLHGLEVSVVTNAKTPEEALVLLRSLGFPFREDKQ